MNSKLRVSVVILLALSLFAACNGEKETKQGLTLNGSITGAEDGSKVELSQYTASGMQKDTAIIKGGKFIIKGDFPNPTLCYLAIADTRAYAQIYVVNGSMTLTANVKDFANMKVTGSKEHDTYAIYQKESNVIRAKYKDIMAALYKPGNTKEKAEELMKQLEPQQVEIDALNAKFIKEYPSSVHAASLVTQQLSGKNYKEAQKIVNSMDPQLQKNTAIVAILAEMAKKGEKDVSIDELMANVKNVSYKVDEKFKGQSLKGIVYLGIFTNNNLCALKKDGTVQILNPSGEEISSFTAKLKGPATSLAVDKDDNIYLLCGIQEEVSKKVRGRVVKRMMPKAVECTVYNAKGTQKSQFVLDGILTATGARVVDNNLVVADYKGSKLAMFDKTNGKIGPVMKDMRPCCGILDFSVNAKKEILVANLGAFRVQGFNFSGESILTFGQRGKTLNDFHGCCNPVSVTSLNSGAIVTVEKDPTRIKVYSKEGAKQIAGIEELVKGCSYIPMIVDTKDNLYLASGEKGMVKCVSVN